jgi:hypothetical protein
VANLQAKTTSELLEIYGSKAPVCVCRPGSGCRGVPSSVATCGPQIKAFAARRELVKRERFPAVTVRERVALAVAIAHARIDGDRSEFDDLWYRLCRRMRAAMQ